MVELFPMTKLILDRSVKQDPAKPELDSDQLLVVAHRAGAMRVLAGPGTGKTTTLVAAMAARLTGPDKLAPDEVLGLTFGRKAAIEWRNQVATATGGGAVPLVSTFHSFCYALIRKFQDSENYQNATRLLSGPEQQQRARQLFNDAVVDRRIEWPDELEPALNTKGLTEEIRAVMARTRSYLLDPVDLEKLGQESRRATWEAIGSFMNEYLDVLDMEGTLDYGELVHRAVILSHRPDVQKYLQTTFKAIYVDEYQDTDPGQVALLKAMVNSQTSLVVVGDVDQAIYGFRGADESGIRNFPDIFQPIFGTPVTDVVLSTCRRFGSQIREVASAVIGDRVPAGFQKADIERHRKPSCPSTSPGLVDLLTFDSDGAQASHIADLVARAKVQNEYKWSQMAIIVRSAVTTLPAIYRALVAAGVPVEIAADEIPLHLDPAVAPLVTALRVVDNERALTPDVALLLLQGPLAQIDPIDIRRLGQYLRKLDGTREQAARPSAQLICEALADPRKLIDIEPGRHDSTIATITKLGNLLNDVRSKMRKGMGPGVVLWEIWQGTNWPTQLERQAFSFGSASQRANRDLDAICALNDLANRFVSRGRGKDLTNFLAEIEAQEIPAGSLAEHDVRSDSVRLLTAHKSKGLQWKYVVIAGAQEDLWPDLRQRQTLLQADRIGPRRELMATTARELLDEERRLFYVAVTRAMNHLVVTAVDTSAKEDGSVPSRFVQDFKDLLPTENVRHLPGRPSRPLSVDGVIAGLRNELSNSENSLAMRKLAAHQLAILAQQGSDTFRAANPQNWWGIKTVTENSKAPSEPISLSPSTVRAIEKCPARWFLERQVQATSQAETVMVFGNAIHAIAQGLQTKEIPLDMAAIDQKLDRLWPGMGYEAPWESQQMRTEAHVVSGRLFAWLVQQGEVDSVAEAGLAIKTSVNTTNPDGAPRVIQLSVSGRADRIEFQADGVVVYDFKTGRNPMDKKDLPTDIQLALYSYLVKSGNYEDGASQKSLAPETHVKGAALVQLRSSPKDQKDLPVVQFVNAGDHDQDSEVSLEERLASAASIILDETYEARYEEQKCRKCPVRIMCPAVPEGRPVL